MTLKIDIQTLSNGQLPVEGKVFIGVFGEADPVTNPITVYSDYLLTTAVGTSAGVDLNFNGKPVVDGVAVTLYVNQSYSLQVTDRYGANVWPKAQQIEISPGGGLNPADDQTITGAWIFDLTTSGVLMTTDDPTFSSPEFFDIVNFRGFIGNTAIGKIYSATNSIGSSSNNLDIVALDDGTASYSASISSAGFGSQANITMSSDSSDDSSVKIGASSLDVILQLINSAADTYSILLTALTSGIKVFHTVANKAVEIHADGLVGSFDDTSTAGDTSLILFDVNAGSMQRVTVGANDSGGAGFKVLRIPN